MISEANVGALHGNVLTALGTGIVSGQHPPGQVLTLEGVSAQHGVSRSVAREVVRVLESMGMVESRRRVGITIQPASKWNVFDPWLIRWRLQAGDRAAQLESLSELRRGFEPAAAALAARRADPHQCRIMAAAVSDMVVHGRSGDLEAYLLAEQTFHHTMLEASGNEMFLALSGIVAEVLTGGIDHGMRTAAEPEGRRHAAAEPEGRRHAAVEPEGRRHAAAEPAAIELHDQVARAIRLRDEEAAERAMRAIIDETMSAVAEAFSEPSQGQGG